MLRRIAREPLLHFLALGLDQGDPVVRRRIAQKMDIISEGLGVAPPSEAELEAYLAANEALYQSLRARYTVRYEGVANPADSAGADTGDPGGP